MRPKPFLQVGLPVICIVGATNLSRIIFEFLPEIFSQNVTLAVQITVSTVFYVLLLKFTGTVTREEKEFLAASLLPTKIYDKKYRASLPTRISDN
jgi:uncharacterized membrane protein YGL010W